MAALLFPLGRIVATPEALNALVVALDRTPASSYNATSPATGATFRPLMLPRIGAAFGTAGAS